MTRSMSAGVGVSRPQYRKMCRKAESSTHERAQVAIMHFRNKGPEHQGKRAESLFPTKATPRLVKRGKILDVTVYQGLSVEPHGIQEQ